MKKKEKKRRPKHTASLERNRGAPQSGAKEGPAPDDSEHGSPPDPDSRIPPDHQHDAREEGRTPEQAVVERAREQQGPPLNPDPADDDRAADK
jgi:hypothetical protein